jgi:type III restriction enzyme
VCGNESLYIRLADGWHLILETKGRDSEQDRTKRRFLEEWVQGVNAYGGFGTWRWAVSKDPGDVTDILRSI